MRRIGTALALLLFVSTGHAQSTDASGVVTVAGWAQTFLAAATTLDAHFQQDSWVRVQARTTTTHGRLRTSRPGHVRLDYDAGGPVIVADGNDYLWYQPGDDTWPGQYARGTNEAVSAAFGALSSGSTLEHDFVIAACASTSSTAPAETTCIELRPRAAHAPFERMRMYVVTSDDERGRPARISVELHDGTWNTFTFDVLRVNPSIDADAFTFEPPAGTREMPGTR